jgi:hypothetical protein
MALTRTTTGRMREVWVEDDPSSFAGDQDVVFQTSIRPVKAAGHDELDYVEIFLYVDAFVGSPVVLDPTASWSADGALLVRVQQFAAAGDGIAFTLDVRDEHTLVR